MRIAAWLQLFLLLRMEAVVQFVLQAAQHYANTSNTVCLKCHLKKSTTWFSCYSAVLWTMRLFWRCDVGMLTLKTTNSSIICEYHTISPKHHFFMHLEFMLPIFLRLVLFMFCKSKYIFTRMNSPSVSPLFLFVLVFVFVLWAPWSETKIRCKIMKLSRLQAGRIDATFDDIVVSTDGNYQAETMLETKQNSIKILLMYALTTRWHDVCVWGIHTCIFSFFWSLRQICKDKIIKTKYN